MIWFLTLMKIHNSSPLIRKVSYWSSFSLKNYLHDSQYSKLLLVHFFIETSFASSLCTMSLCIWKLRALPEMEVSNNSLKRHLGRWKKTREIIFGSYPFMQNFLGSKHWYTTIQMYFLAFRVKEFFSFIILKYFESKEYEMGEQKS